MDFGVRLGVMYINTQHNSHINKRMQILAGRTADGVSIYGSDIPASLSPAKNQIFVLVKNRTHGMSKWANISVLSVERKSRFSV